MGRRWKDTHPATSRLPSYVAEQLARQDFPDYMPTSSGLAVALGRECSSFEGTGADSSESQVFLKIP